VQKEIRSSRRLQLGGLDRRQEALSMSEWKVLLRPLR
jgi:hypothetical protein